MGRLTRLLCLTTALLLMPLCYGLRVVLSKDEIFHFLPSTVTSDPPGTDKQLLTGEEDQEYNMTTQDYGDYNATFDYIFYSNSSTEDLDKFLSDSEEEEDQEPEVVDEELEITTMTAVDVSTASRTSEASASLLFVVVLTLHLLPRL